MSEIVRARTDALPTPFQTDLADQPREHLTNGSVAEPTAAHVEEERWCLGARAQLITSPCVCVQRVGCGRVHRYLALPLLFADADVHHAVIKVDVVPVQSECLPDPQPAAGHQS